MSINYRRCAAVIVAAGTITGASLAPVLAFAQTATPASSAAPAPGAARHDASVERRIATLHSRLKITPSQEQTFNAFADVMRQNATHMDGLVQKRVALPASATAVDEMQTYNDMAQAHAADMQRLMPVFSALYDTLSPEQKKLADTDFRHLRENGREPRT